MREKAKGGIALTMIGGSSVVAPDSPQAFGNIQLYKDEVVRWLRELADDVHGHGAAVMIQITHLGRRTNWAKADWLPIVAPSSIREAAHRAYPKAMEDWDIARVIVKAYADAAERVKAAGLDGIELECYGAPHRPVLVAGDEQARRRVRRLARQPDALRASRSWTRSAPGSGRISSSAPGWSATSMWSGASSATEGLEIARRLVRGRA